MEAVYTLFDLDRGVPEVFASPYDIRCLIRVAHHMLDGRKLQDMRLPFLRKMVLKKIIKKTEGTTIHEMLKENALI